MIRKINKQNGFTLIEVIVVLIIVGIMAAFAGMAIVTGVKAYMFSKNNAAISEKAQLALARINRELMECYNCTWVTPGGQNVGLPIINTHGERYIQLNTVDVNNKYIEISNNSGFNKTGTSPSGISYYSDDLINSVNSFTMVYSTGDKSIRVTMSLIHPDGATLDFSTNVFPRNTNN